MEKEPNDETSTSIQKTNVDLLNEQLSEPALESSARIKILILLSIHRRISLVELRKFIGLVRSSLGNHLEKLEAVGYAKVRVINSFAGKRQVFEITYKGLEECRTLLERIRSLDI